MNTDLKNIVQELAIPWVGSEARARNLYRKIHLTVSDCFDGFELAAFQCTKENTDHIGARIYLDSDLQRKVNLYGASYVVGILATAVDHVTGMIADLENKNDPKTKRLAWHKRKR